MVECARKRCKTNKFSLHEFFNVARITGSYSPVGQWMHIFSVRSQGTSVRISVYEPLHETERAEGS